MPLTKSLFTTSLGCPRKLYYAVHKEQYDNTNSDNDFMRSLAEGGIQVGALARHYYFSKYKSFAQYYIETKDKDMALRQTAEAMCEQNAVIAEAAFKWNGCFVRVDILVKRGSTIQLVEVKSSSLRPKDEDKIVNVTKKGEVNSSYRKYIYDLAFQKYVVENALGESVEGYLMLINTDKQCDVDGLNQMISINTKTQIVDVSGLQAYTPPINESDWLLLPCDMNQVCDAIIENRTAEQTEYMGTTFTDYVDMLLESMRSDVPIAPRISSQCKGCEFRSSDKARSGYHRCWSECAGFTDADFEKPHTLELWGGKGFRKAKQLIAEGKYFLSDLKPLDYFNPKDTEISLDMSEFNSSSRRQMQIEKWSKGNMEPVLLPGLKAEMDEW